MLNLPLKNLPINSIFTLFLFVSLYWTPPIVLACQPEVKFPYVLELNDGVHIFVMGAEMGFLKKVFERKNEELPQEYAEIYKHEISGVYKKGHPETAIWKWKGPFIDRDRLSRSISSDGRIFFQVNPPGWKDDVFLSLYHNGELVREIGMERFIDSPDQTARFPCSLPEWARTWEYDESLKRLKIESYASRVLEVDAVTGDVVSTQSIEIKNILGRVLLRSGQGHQVNHVGICKVPEQKNKMGIPPGMEILKYYMRFLGTEYVRDSDGLTDVPAILIRTVEESEIAGSNATFQMINVATIRMDRIQKMKFNLVPGTDDVLTEVMLIDSSSLKWRIGTNEWIFCAQQEDEGYVEMPPNRLESLTLFNPQTGV